MLWGVRSGALSYHANGTQSGHGVLEGYMHAFATGHIALSCVRYRPEGERGSERDGKNR